MKCIFTILILLMTFVTFSINAQEVISVEGEYSYGPDISQNEACKRATKIGKNEAIRRASGESVSSDIIENCVQEDCKLYEKTWSSLGNNTIIKSTSNFNKYIFEKLGEKICKVTFDAEVFVIKENINNDFYITTNFGSKKKIFKASSSEGVRDGDPLKVKITLSKPAYLYVYAWYPIDNENKLIEIVSYPQNAKIKKSYDFPPNGEAYFTISLSNKQNYASEYLLFIASRQKINLD
ncbi:DUF4384 domain-containing protein, partial [Alphaproteobacteria bacterium]|nr:DUF4384 domain-containing protein [Alphaproteobacteria bacterium]